MDRRCELRDSWPCKATSCRAGPSAQQNTELRRWNRTRYRELKVSGLDPPSNRHWPLRKTKWAWQLLGPSFVAVTEKLRPELQISYDEARSFLPAAGGGGGATIPPPDAASPAHAPTGRAGKLESGGLADNRRTITLGRRSEPATK